MFTKDFDAYVVVDDFITCEVDGFTARATLYYDGDTELPEDASPKAKAAWLADEWHYYGVAVTIWKDDVRLTGEYDHALWGIEGNYPGDEKGNPNTYFRDVANDYLPEALADAKAKIAKWANEF